MGAIALGSKVAMVLKSGAGVKTISLLAAGDLSWPLSHSCVLTHRPAGHRTERQ